MNAIIIPALISGFVGCSVVAALSDVSELRIPNWLCATVALLFAGYAGSALDISQFVLSLGVGVATLATGYLLFSRGWLGGGDAKMLAAAALWAGPAHVAELFAVTALTGGVLALALQAPFTASLQARWARVAPAHVAPMPYGVAIAAGALVVATRLLAGSHGVA